MDLPQQHTINELRGLIMRERDYAASKAKDLSTSLNDSLIFISSGSCPLELQQSLLEHVYKKFEELETCILILAD